MKRVICSLASDPELNELKKRIVDEDLYAICYGITYPAGLAKKLIKSGELSDRKVIDYDGLFSAASYEEYRRKVASIVMNYGGYAESSYQFYTIYNRDCSSNREALSQFKSAFDSGDIGTLSSLTLTPEILSYVNKVSSGFVKNLFYSLKNALDGDVSLDSAGKSPQRALKSWSTIMGANARFGLGEINIDIADDNDNEIIYDVVSSNGWLHSNDESIVNGSITYYHSEYPYINMWVTTYDQWNKVDMYIYLPVKLNSEDSVVYSIDVDR